MDTRTDEVAPQMWHNELRIVLDWVDSIDEEEA